MKENNTKLHCEMSYKERLKANFRENSMLYKFYLWLFKKNEKQKETTEN